jgi:hypothetical protein
MRSGAIKATTLVALVLGLFLASVPTSGAAGASRRTSPHQFGIDTYFVYNCQSQTLIDKWATTQVDDFKALGANSIGIGFPLYTDTLTSNDVYAKLQCNNSGNTSPYQTPPPLVLASVIQIAHNAGLKVLLRPLLDQQNLYAQNSNWWRGVLAPTNPQEWINNYLTTLRPYLLVAQDTKTQYFAIETELDSLGDAQFWPAALALSHSIYKGSIVFNYSWGDPEGKKVAHPGTSMGIDTYPKTTALPNATVEQLLAQWNYLLRTAYEFRVPNLQKVAINEIGISAQDGMYTQPQRAGAPLSQYPYNQAIQANWFEAACAFSEQHKLQGIYYWGPWLTSYAGALPKQPLTELPTDIQPAGAIAIKKCFRSRAWQ